MKEKKTYTDGMADVLELTLKTFDEMSEAYQILQQVSAHQSDMTHGSPRNYTEHIALIAVLQTRFENRYWDAMDERKRGNCDQL